MTGHIEHIGQNQDFEDDATIFFRLGSAQARIGMERLEGVAEQMRGEIDIADRVYHLRTFNNCFVGSDAVEWMIASGMVPSVDSALHLGNVLLDNGLIHHVTDDMNRFKNEELFYRFKSRRLRAVITVSEASKQRLVEVGVPQERVQVIHNGVDLQRFQPPDSPSSSGPFRFAYPSRILPGKGQHLAIDAFARLPKALKQKAHLDIVGAAVDKVFLDQLKVQAHGLNVSFNVDVPKIAPFYQRADAVLFPTLMQEGFGFTAVEGMACGKPVIWTEQPAIREATGGIGLSFASGDVAAMRDHMVRLMSEPELARELGDQGRRYVSAHYDWAQVWRSYERVLAEVIQG